METKRTRGGVCFTLDVLTDGSEFTGHGTVFLSVWKAPRLAVASAEDASDTGVRDHSWLEESMSLHSPLARYAISGLGDATARLCADQRLKLAATQAAFLPTFDCGDGLAALILALHSAGAPSLHLVSTDGGRMEELAGIVLGPRKQLQISNCQVPITPESTAAAAAAAAASSSSSSPSPSSSSSSVPSWWQVYTDEYLTVHASRLDRQDLSSVTFLYTMRHDKQTSTLVLLPPKCPDVNGTYQQLTKSQLPVLDDNTTTSIDYVLALDPKQKIGEMSNDSCPGVHFMGTLPDNTARDRGILIRSQQVTEHLSIQLPELFPKFPRTADRHERSSTADRVVLEESDLSTSNKMEEILRLQSGTSIILDWVLDGPHNSQPKVLDRCQSTWNRPLNDNWSSTVQSLQSLLVARPFTSVVADEDENEIDLDDDDDDDVDNDANDATDANDASEGVGGSNISDLDPYIHTADKPTSPPGPELLVLGTGCATPSAIRGASGYALVFPPSASTPEENTPETDTEIFLLDCGEGVATMLSRHGRFRPHWFRCIRGIWISHAHLDHYGGLPTMLRLIRHHQQTIMVREAKNSARHSEPPEPKRTKHFSPPFPNTNGGGVDGACWVMAPPKVLRFLDLCLGCKHGRRLDTGEQVFVPRFFQDPTPAPGPWHHFQSISVNHNCCPAYGLLIGWKTKTKTCHPHRSNTTEFSNGTHQSQWLCFSGDTRPSRNLVTACRQATVRVGGSGSGSTSSEGAFLLVHEATYEDSEQDQAIRKKHSTISEARQVAQDCGATQLLATHFSQRYVSLQVPTQRHDSTTNYAVPMGLAMDGLCLSWTLDPL